MCAVTFLIFNGCVDLTLLKSNGYKYSDICSESEIHFIFRAIIVIILVMMSSSFIYKYMFQRSNQDDEGPNLLDPSGEKELCATSYVNANEPLDNRYSLITY